MKPNPLSTTNFLIVPCGITQLPQTLRTTLGSRPATLAPTGFGRGAYLPTSEGPTGTSRTPPTPPKAAPPRSHATAGTFAKDWSPKSQEITGQPFELRTRPSTHTCDSIACPLPEATRKTFFLHLPCPQLPDSLAKSPRLTLKDSIGGAVFPNH
jgi:hypothetical protein